MKRLKQAGVLLKAFSRLPLIPSEMFLSFLIFKRSWGRKKKRKNNRKGHWEQIEKQNPAPQTHAEERSSFLSSFSFWACFLHDCVASKGPMGPMREPFQLLSSSVTVP